MHSAYSASTFYAADRYISFRKDWIVDYTDGKRIISARYTTSNAIYQMTKLPRELWDEYCAWLYDYEYNKLGIPAPDAVIFLDVPVEISQRLLTERMRRIPPISCAAVKRQCMQPDTIRMHRGRSSTAARTERFAAPKAFKRSLPASLRGSDGRTHR